MSLKILVIALLVWAAGFTSIMAAHRKPSATGASPIAGESTQTPHRRWISTQRSIEVERRERSKPNSRIRAIASIETERTREATSSATRREIPAAKPDPTDGLDGNDGQD